MKKLTKYLKNLTNKNNKNKNKIKNKYKYKNSNITQQLTKDILEKQYQIQPFLVLGSAPNPTFLHTHTLAMLALTPTTSQQNYELQTDKKIAIIIKVHLLSNQNYLTLQITQQNSNQIIQLNKSKILILNKNTKFTVITTLPQYVIIEVVEIKDNQDIEDIIEINKSYTDIEEECEEDEDKNSEDSNFLDSENLESKHINSKLTNITKRLKQITAEQLQLGQNYLLQTEKNIIQLPSYQFKYPIMWDDKIWQDNKAQHPELVINIEQTNIFKQKYPEENIIVYDN